MTRRHAGWILIAVIAAAGAILRIAAALLRRPWHDEYFTVWVATLPWSELVPALAQDSGPPLPYTLAKLVALTGLAPLAAARLVAVGAGILAILVVADAAGKTAGPRAASWAAVLLALHPLAVAWSCEGRAYTLLLLGAALVWNGLAGLMNQKVGAWRVTSGAILAVWSHGLGLILVALIAVASPFLPVSARRRSIGAAALAILSFLPWLPVMLAQPPASLAWMARAWDSLSAWQGILAPIAFVAPSGRFGTAMDLPSAPALIAVVAALATLGLAAAAIVGRRPPVLLAASLVAVPALALAVLAQLSLPVFYPGRGEALYLAPAVGLLAAGAVRGRPLALVALLLAGAGAVTCGFALVDWKTTPSRPEEHLARAVVTHLPGGGTVLVEGYWRLGLWYHLGDARSRFILETFPPAAHAHPGWYEGGATPADAELARQHLAAEVQRGRPVACLLPPREAKSALRPAAAAAGLGPAASTPGAELWVWRGGAP